MISKFGYIHTKQIKAMEYELKLRNAATFSFSQETLVFTLFLFAYNPPALV